VIVDDEPLARERVRTLLSRHGDVVLVGECSDGPEAISTLRRDSPDLVFLDVQMPGCDGFDVLEAVSSGTLPAVILVTAFDQYALKAFEVHAVDYLLKPFDEGRFDRALDRARETIRQDNDDVVRERLFALLADLRAHDGKVERFVVKGAGRIVFLKVTDVDFIESAGNYVCLHVGAETHILRETMASIEGQLDPERFVRIHRGAIVNIDRIKELQPLFHGEFQVRLVNGTELVLSRGCRERFEAAIGRSL
jgi:two-component system LytT family response regulator